MATEKTVMLNVRLKPAYKKALEKLAAQEHRTITGQVEHFIATECGAAGIKISAVGQTHAGLRKASKA